MCACNFTSKYVVEINGSAIILSTRLKSYKANCLLAIDSNSCCYYGGNNGMREKERTRFSYENKRNNFLIFSLQQSDFMVYSTYCNSYPHALMELENYTGNSDAMALLEKYVFSCNMCHQDWQNDLNLMCTCIKSYRFF